LVFFTDVIIKYNKVLLYLSLLKNEKWRKIFTEDKHTLYALVVITTSYKEAAWYVVQDKQWRAILPAIYYMKYLETSAAILNKMTAAKRGRSSIFNDADYSLLEERTHTCREIVPFIINDILAFDSKEEEAISADEGAAVTAIRHAMHEAVLADEEAALRQKTRNFPG
jgi:hypothetical protein